MAEKKTKTKTNAREKWLPCDIQETSPQKTTDAQQNLQTPERQTANTGAESRSRSRSAEGQRDTKRSSHHDGIIPIFISFLS